MRQRYRIRIILIENGPGDTLIDREWAVLFHLHVDEGAAPSQYFYAEDEEYSQEYTRLDAVEPVISFTTSVTSSFSTLSVTRSKRNRGSRTPPTELQVPKKKNLAKMRTRDSAP